MLELALMAFIDDTRQLVSEGVSADIEHLISIAGSEPGDALGDAARSIVKDRAKEHGKERKIFLKKWLKLDRPLCYSENDSDETYQTLLQAVVCDREATSSGLPHLKANAMTLTQFANLLIEMSSPVSPTAPTAPVLATGSFLPILKDVHRNVLDLSQEQDHEASRSFLSTLLLRALDYLQIRFVPFHLPNGGRHGAPYRKPVFNSWAHLGVKDAARPHSLSQVDVDPSSSQEAAEVALVSALADDSNADWFTGQLTLETLCTILHKTRLPSDFRKPSPASEQYVDDTYAWVRQAYDGTKPLHHLALLVAIIASQFVPTIFMPKGVNKKDFKNASPKQVREIYGRMGWVSRGPKGKSDKTIFVAMITSFIIALYEPDSPLRQHIQRADKHGLGDAWTYKNSTHCIFFLCVY